MNFVRALRALPVRLLIAAMLYSMVGSRHALAEQYALLIGAANYLNKSITPLKGPPNDVTLIWRALTKRGFSKANMIVYAGNLPTGPDFPLSLGEATKIAILEGFAAVAERAKEDDAVLIYFSGHGSQQPVQNVDQDPEGDNLDQVMLPVDAGNFDDLTQTIMNGIVDDAVGVAIDRIRDKGAHVWAVIDACHAGSMTRGAIDGVIARGVDPAVLGIRPSPSQASWARPQTARHLPSRSTRGSLVGFFAVDSSKEAVERRFEEFDKPMISSGGRPSVGVFTYFLHKILSDPQYSFLTYRHLAHLLISDMQQSPLSPSSLPVFDGDLNETFLFSAREPPIPSWLVTMRDERTLEIPAGILHGLTPNTVLRLTTMASVEEWAQATVTSAFATRSIATVTARRNTSAPPLLWATVLSPGVSFELSVSEPPPSDMSATSAILLIDAVKATLSMEGSTAIKWVAPQDAAGVRLRIRDDRIWLLPVDGEWSTPDTQKVSTISHLYPATPSFLLGSEQITRRIAQSLKSIARASSVVRLAQAASAENDLDGYIEVNANRVRPSETVPPKEPCRSAIMLTDQSIGHPIELSSPSAAKGPSKALIAPRVYHCDLIQVAISNTSDRDFSINVSYVDANSGIWPLHNGCTITIPRHQTYDRTRLWIKTWDSQSNAPSTIGREHIVITAAELRNGIEPDLCFVQDPVRSVETLNNRKQQSDWPRLLKSLRDAKLGLSRGAELSLNTQTATQEPIMGMYLLSFEVSVGNPPPDN